jgi:hypothetical protein
MKDNPNSRPGLSADLLELPFDQYQRYRLLAELVQILDEEGRARILEVGGAPVKIPDFLPGCEITVADQIQDHHAAYVRADAVNLPFADNSFELVASLDTLEHILPERRESFMAELVRISSKLVILAAPFHSGKSRQAEQIIFDFIKAHLGYEHQYFKEHLAHEKPDMLETESYFISQNYHTLILPNGRLDRWLLMMFVYYYLEGNDAYKELNRGLSAFYNQHYYTSDNAEPAYRHFLVASQDAFGDRAERILALADSEPGYSPDFQAVQSLIELARLEQDKSLRRRIEQLEDLLRTRDEELQGLREHVKRLQDFVSRARATPFYKIYARFFKKRNA